MSSQFCSLGFYIHPAFNAEDSIVETVNSALIRLSKISRYVSLSMAQKTGH